MQTVPGAPAAARESGGLSISHMLRTDLLPVDAAGNFVPTAITAAAQALDLARPAARDEETGTSARVARFE